MLTLDEATLDNLLVAQKDRIIAEVNTGNYQNALSQLVVVADLWRQTGYNYKGREICERILYCVESVSLGVKTIKSQCI